MSYKADARMQAVARFREKVGDFAQRSAEDFRYLLQLLRDARAEIAGKVRAYEECVVSARGLLAQARGKKSAYANARAGLESELSRTDKTVSRQSASACPMQVSALRRYACKNSRSCSRPHSF